MARRVKTKRLAIMRIGDNFEKSQHEMALKLNAKLGTHCNSRTNFFFDVMLTFHFGLVW